MHQYVPVALSIALALGVSVTAIAEAAQPPVPSIASIAIPPMPLKQALREFAKREHLQFVYVSQIADNVRTTGARAGMSQRSALKALLRGTGLQYRYLDADTVTISRIADPPLTSDPTPNARRTKVTKKGPPKTLQTVIVTGTRAFGRTAVDSLSPIDVLTPQELISTGAPDLTSALRTLLPSFNFPQPDVDDATTASQPAQLRGLAPDETLVLINGKRVHNTATLNVTEAIGRGSSPVDLSAIPINAIERIEVLRDGAAAQYGSGAIAGVINIILKGGGGDHGSAHVTYGHHAGQTGGTVQSGADAGFSLGNKGWVHVSANYMNQFPSNTAGPDFRFPADPTFGKVTFDIGFPKTVSKQAAINAEYFLGNNATLYAFSVFNQRHVQPFGFFRSRSQEPPGAQTIFPDGLLPAEHSSLRDDNTVVGVRGTALGWHYDISADTGGNNWKMFMTNDLNYALGAASPTSFFIGTLKNRQDELNADFRRDVDVGWHAPLTVAWGLAYRYSDFTIKPGEPDSYVGGGSQAFGGFQPSDAGSHSRRDTAEYIDLSTNLTSALSTEFAARHERYSDFGNATVWKLSGRYAFTPTVAIRGSVSTGFRAPSLQQEFYSSTSIQFDENHNLVTVHTFPVSDPAAAALGAEALDPEKSRNYSIGMVFTPHNGLYTTIDAYQINIRDRILLSADLTGPTVESYLESIGFPGVFGGNFFTNAVSTRTRGADVVTAWPIQLPASQLKLTGGLNYNWTEVTKLKPNPPQDALAGLVLPVAGRRELSLITTAIPRTKMFLGADWTFDHWTLHGQATRYGKWTFSNTSLPSGDQTFGAKVLLDASVTYNLRHWAFTLGGNNIANIRPEKNNPALNLGGILTYPKTSPFGLGGSYWYGTVAYRW